MRIPSKSVLRLVGLGVSCAAAVVFAETKIQPIFLDRALASRLVIASATKEERAMRLAPWSRLSFEDALASPAFLRDRSAFALDLVNTGKVRLGRALALADVAVREAYRRQIPPALVLGVLLTENDELKSRARSRQGALGLMQIHPGPWRDALGELFGRNLRNDTTNLRYGVYILSHYAGRATAENDTSNHWRQALLRYNGCVNGSNTPDCHAYPEAVKREVQRSARTICDGRNFDWCVVTPLRLARRGD